MPTLNPRQVFISYRQENAAHGQAVRALAEGLQAEGIPVELDQFHIDQFPGGPDEGWPKWSIDRASKSQAVVVIASPGWFAAYQGEGPNATGRGAASEARVIRQFIYDTQGVNPRIRFVEVETSGQGEYPPDLKSWHRFRPSARPDDLAQLAAWLRQRLGLQAAGAPAPQRLVYLAETYLDDDPQRACLAQELRDAGWEVLPAGEYRDETYESEATADIDRAIAFVQVLHPQRWKGARRDILQYEIAARRGLPCLRFRDLDLDPAKVADEEQRRFLTADPLVRVRQFAQFKTEMLQELNETWEKLHRPPPEPAKPGRPVRKFLRVVMRTGDAARRWAAVFQWLDAQADILFEKVDDYDAAAQLLTTRQRQRACHGFLFVCDRAFVNDPRLSPSGALEECQILQIDSKEDRACPPVGVLFWPPPAEEAEAWPLVFSHKLPRVFRMLVRDDTAPPMEDFLRAVREVEV